MNLQQSKQVSPVLRGSPLTAAPGVHSHPFDRRIKLRVHPTGKRAWFIRTRVNGAQKYVEFPADLSVAAVQVEAARAFALRDTGIDPAAHKALEQQRRREEHEEAMRAQITLEAVRDELMRTPRVRALRAPSLKNLQWALSSDYVKPLLSRPVRSITTKSIEAIQAGLMEQGKLSTWHTAGGALKRLMRFAVQREYITKDPMQGVSVGGAPERPDGMLRGCDWSEVVATWKAIDEHARLHPRSPLADMWRVMALTGLRPGAVERLREEDFRDGDEPVIVIPAAASKLGKTLTVPVSRQCADILRRVIATRGDRWTAAQRKSDLLFPGIKGGPMTKQQTAFDEVTRLRGGQWAPFRPHRWRKTVIEWLTTQSGAPHLAICRLIDWKAPGMVDNYVQAQNIGREYIQRWADALDRAVAGESNVITLARSA